MKNKAKKFLKDEITSLRKRGFAISELELELGVSEKTIRRMITEETKMVDRNSKGKIALEYAIRILKKNSETSSREIFRKMNSSGINIGMTTVIIQTSKARKILHAKALKEAGN